MKRDGLRRRLDRDIKRLKTNERWKIRNKWSEKLCEKNEGEEKILKMENK